MTLSQIQQAVLLNTNRSDKAAVALLGINFALQEISQVHQFRPLRYQVDVGIATGDNSFNLPNDSCVVVDLRAFDSTGTLAYEVEILPKKTVVGMNPNLSQTSTGRPCTGFIEGGVFYFLPPSAQEYTLKLTYDDYHLDLASDDDVTIIKGLDYAVICYATAYVFRSIEMFENAMVFMQEYARALTVAKRHDDRNTGTIKQMAGAKLDNGGVAYVNPYENRFTKT